MYGDASHLRVFRLMSLEERFRKKKKCRLVISDY